MPITVRIDAARRRVELTANGLLTGEEIEEAQKEIARNEGFEASFDALFDLAGLSNVEISANSAARIVSQTLLGPRVRRAFVTNSPLAFGMARRFGSLLGDRGGEIEMFEDRATAERWLNRE